MSITVREVWELKEFQAFQLVAGEKGLDNRIDAVGILDYEYALQDLSLIHICTRNAVVRKGTWVRIPHSPLSKNPVTMRVSGFFLFCARSKNHPILVSFYRLAEVAIYSLLNFLPFLALALYPFRHSLRFSIKNAPSAVLPVRQCRWCRLFPKRRRNSPFLITILPV